MRYEIFIPESRYPINGEDDFTLHVDFVLPNQYEFSFPETKEQRLVNSLKKIKGVADLSISNKYRIDFLVGKLFDINLVVENVREVLYHYDQVHNEENYGN